jgi:hypothetical protein
MRHLLMAVMVVIAAAVLIPPVFIILLQVSGHRIDDDFYPASSAPVERFWPSSPSPKVVVESPDAAVYVNPSADGRIKVSVTRRSLCKNLSQAVAEDSLRFLRVEMVREGDTIRVVTVPTENMPKNEFEKTGTYITVYSIIEISVPDGARLDLSKGARVYSVEGKLDEIPATKDVEASVAFDGASYQFRGVVKPNP